MKLYQVNLSGGTVFVLADALEEAVRAAHEAGGGSELNAVFCIAVEGQNLLVPCGWTLQPVAMH